MRRRGYWWRHGKYRLICLRGIYVLKGLRFTLEVDGQEPDTFAVVNFRLIQNQSYPFVMSVDVASDSFMQTAEMLLE
ncbi:hypothetical protein FCY42_25385, partial [Escherichia coli]|nr:hypothetical protein [Escherichia coli]